MSIPQDEVQFFLPSGQKEALRELSNTPWQKLFAQSGIISNKKLAKDHVYTIRGLMVKTNIRSLILLDSKKLSDLTEIFRIYIVTDENNLTLMLDRTYPRLLELIEFPDDLRIEQFLGIRNEIYLLRFKEEIENGKGFKTRHAISESGLLMSNSNSRMILYPDLDIPLDFCITTDDEIIDEILRTASIDNISGGKKAV